MDKTIFRIYPDTTARCGEVIALFPQIANRLDGYLCQSYMHIGQHGAANIDVVVSQTRLATEQEYESLLKELEQIGYNPVVMKRCTWKDLRIRQKQAKSWK
ncbi:hypothetical protein KAR91_57720 [Candidatus Pacearchaeota archaeon]|nr:hypothetical protein [Candidatus Pacearchaeota archaeon]